MYHASRIILSFVSIVFFLLLLFPTRSYAQTPVSAATTIQTQNLSVVTQQVTLSVLTTIACQLTGINPSAADKKCFTIDPATQQLTAAPNDGGLIGAMGGLIAATYTPPIRTHQFISYMSDNFGLVKPAHAQGNQVGRINCTVSGIGYCGLLPLLNIWKAFRDLAFLVFTFVFTLLGLGVMLRVKVDPRTVMTLENQIPRVIIGIILITFSFAIAGFLVDMMYVAIYVIFSFFSNENLYPTGYQQKMIESVAAVQKGYLGDNPFGVFNNLIGGGPGGGIWSVVVDASGGAGDIVGGLFTKPVEFSFTDLFIKGFFDAIRNLIGMIFSTIASIAVFLVLAIAVLVALFRVWFALIFAYVYLLLDVVIAPIWIMAGIFPGSAASFDSWIRDMLANLSAFPTVIAMFLFARLFMYAFVEQANPLLILPLIGNPLRNNADMQPIASLIAVFVLLMTPGVVKMTKEFFKAPEFKWTATAFQQLGKGAEVPGKVMQGGVNQAFGVHYGATGAHTSGLGASRLGGAMRAMGFAR